MNKYWTLYSTEMKNTYQTRERHVSRVWDHDHWIPGKILTCLHVKPFFVAHLEPELCYISCFIDTWVAKTLHLKLHEPVTNKFRPCYNYIKHMGHKLNFCTVYSVAQMHYYVKRVTNYKPLYFRQKKIQMVKIQSFCAH